MKKNIDLFTRAISPSPTHDEIEDEIQRFLANGGTINRMTHKKKGIREEPSKGAIFLSSRDERYSED
jgi:hypothetical protein